MTGADILLTWIDSSGRLHLQVIDPFFFRDFQSIRSIAI